MSAPQEPGRDPAGDVDELAAAIRRSDRTALGRAITLVESRRPADRERAQHLLEHLLPHTGGAHRIGLSGVPGVGKSTLIEALGCRLIEQGHRLAVLAVDPSSPRSGGSILGDKTRMNRLAASPAAFVRPSPSGGTLGGVAARTRESLLVCEAAGFDLVLVETVGTGQSEIAVASMVDTFVLCLLPGAGDELQGIKKGVLELADVLLITKADGANRERAEPAAAELRSALRILHAADGGSPPPVEITSALDGTGLDRAWAAIRAHREQLEAGGELAAKRQRQAVDWMWSLVEERLLERVRRAEGVAELEARVRSGELPPSVAAERLLRSSSS